MRIFHSFLSIMGAIILLLMPVASGVYSFRTDVREDTFQVTTAAGVTGANVTLLKALFDDDTGTISFTSDIAEVPVVSSWNGTTRQLEVGGLTASESRELVVSYDKAAFAATNAISNLMDSVPFIWFLMILAFVPASLVAIFLGRA